MKEFIQSILQPLIKERIVTNTVYVDRIVTPPVPEKTNREKLYDLAVTFLGIDPTPKDEQSDEFACSEVISTLLKKYLGDFPIINYTPDLLKKLKADNRFKSTIEIKLGTLIISPTLSGNGKVVGHVGLFGKDGKILSNSSSTGLFLDKFDTISWIQRYSKAGQLDIYLFDLV